jgi:hypothetical protein
MNSAKRARWIRPLVQPDAADAERIFDALARAGAEAVERDRKGMDAQPGHV